MTAQMILPETTLIRHLVRSIRDNCLRFNTYQLPDIPIRVGDTGMVSSRKNGLWFYRTLPTATDPQNNTVLSDILTKITRELPAIARGRSFHLVSLTNNPGLEQDTRFIGLAMCRCSVFGSREEIVADMDDRTKLALMETGNKPHIWAEDLALLDSVLTEAGCSTPTLEEMEQLMYWNTSSQHRVGWDVRAVTGFQTFVADGPWLAETIQASEYPLVCSIRGDISSSRGSQRWVRRELDRYRTPKAGMSPSDEMSCLLDVKAHLEDTLEPLVRGYSLTIAQAVPEGVPTGKLLGTGLNRGLMSAGLITEPAGRLKGKLVEAMLPGSNHRIVYNKPFAHTVSKGIVTESGFSLSVERDASQENLAVAAI